MSTLECTIALSKSSTTCLLHCILSWFLKAEFQTVGPDILAIINCSLSNGTFPSYFKHAPVHPLLKKTSLDFNACKTLNGQAPAYICDLLTPYESDHHLKSKNGNGCYPSCHIGEEFWLPKIWPDRGHSKSHPGPFLVWQTLDPCIWTLSTCG